MAHKNKTNISPYKARRRSPAKQSGTSRGHQKPTGIYAQGEASDRLADIFRNHDFGHISYAEIGKLAQFYRLLMERQATENFTRLLKFSDIGIKHFIDCLIVPQLVDLKFPLLDLGTGPGFPGIPLKIHFPDNIIILAEGVQRRVEFLKDVRDGLELKKLKIIGRNVNPFFAYPVNGVITRAVEDIRNTLNNVSTCLQTGGEVYFMKGPGVDPEIALAKKECGEFFSLVKDIPYDLPKTSHKRRLLVYKKIKPTPLIDFEDEPWPGEDE